LHISSNKRSRGDSSKDNEYNDNISSSSPILQKEESIYQGENTTATNNEKPLAKLLVVDNDADVLEVFKLSLLQNGFLVHAFTIPEEALESFKSDPKSYSLVLSDIRMPGISGIQLAKKVREINPDVKVVLMTAFDIRDKEFSTVFPSTEVDGFIQKPVSIKSLSDRIMTILGGDKRGGG